MTSHLVRVLLVILAIGACACTGLSRELATELKTTSGQPLVLRTDGGGLAELSPGGYFIKLSPGFWGNRVLKPRVILDSPQGEVSLSVPSSALGDGKALIRAAGDGQPYDIEISTERSLDTDPASLNESVSCTHLAVCDNREGRPETQLDCPGSRWQEVKYFGTSVRFTARVLDHGAEIATFVGASHDGAERRLLREGPCN